LQRYKIFFKDVQPQTHNALSKASGLRYPDFIGSNAFFCRLSPFAFRLSPFAFRLSPFDFRLSTLLLYSAYCSFLLPVFILLHIIDLTNEYYFTRTGLSLQGWTSFF
jgi:hypothetical protein